jgi:4a-hydroxytetrahydrobiopterin dehydratase
MMTATPTKLANFEVESVLTQLPGWTVVAGKLHREYRFPNFGKAFGFMKTAALAIEKMDHHPEWFNAYDRVVVDLTTHDAGGISQKDVDLAKQLEEIAGKLM